MPRRKLSMRKIKEVARLKASGLKIRAIARSCTIPRSTVQDYLNRLENAGLSWPFADGLSEEQLDEKLFNRPVSSGRNVNMPLPDWDQVDRQFRLKGVTLQLLWEEYRAVHTDGYGYSQFCVLYRQWKQTLDICMRQRHRAGEKLFVDYAGMTMPITDRATGATHPAQIFVAALGASQYIYAEATRTQQLADWIGSHVRSFDHLGGVPEVVVPDNLRSGVSRACRYEPDINPTYADLASYYDTAVIPARPRKAQDKAKVESAVQIVERQVLARLRDRTFFSVGELNRAMVPLLRAVNTRAFQKLDASRLELFEQIDKPALKPLPARPYEYCEYVQPKVNIDYHVEVRGHYYSVPFKLRGQRVDVRITARMVEVLHRGGRVASHVRDDRKGSHTTEPSHMPKAHRAHLEWSPSRLIHWAGTIGPQCAKAVETIIRSRPHPEQGYRACLGLMRLGKGYGSERLEAACRRAVALDVCAYRSIKAMLETGKDAEPLPSQGQPPDTCSKHHNNVRGKDYYSRGPNTQQEEFAYAQ